MIESFHVVHQKVRVIAIGWGVASVACVQLLNAHIVDVDLCPGEARSLEERSDKIERDRKDHEAAERVRDGSANQKDIERTINEIERGA